MRINAAILINDVGINICHHLHLCMARITLDCFHIAAIQFEFVSNTGMPERMENHMGESVFLDELVKGPVDDLTFHRASVTGAEHKIVVDVFITEQVFQLVNFDFSVHQHFSNRLGKVDPPNTGLGLWFFQNKCCMGACDTRRKLFDYPFIAEIGGEHIIGGAGHLYCIVPQDENATLAINRIRWNGKTGTYEVTDVLYRSETGEPVLLFANLDDIPSLADTQVFVTDSSGNTCEWYPTLDEQNVIVPCVTEDGVYHATDFTEYGWQGTPSVLSDWLANGYGGPTALGLAGWEGAGSYWTTSTTVGESDRSAFFCLCVYPGDDSGGTADLYWMREDDYSYEAYWSGYWEIETVMEGPSYVTLTLFDTGSENPGTAESLCIDETYPMLISPSGLELVIGAGENGVCLPFMSQSTEVCVLTLAEG